MTDSTNGIIATPYAPSIFTLGGYPYTAPQKCGVGVFARYREEYIRAFKHDCPDQRPTTANLQAWEQQHTDSGTFERLNAAAIFRALLTPVEGSPDLETAFDIASDAEASAVISFFTESEAVSTAVQQSSQSASSGTTPTRQTRKTSTRKRG